MTLRNEGTIIDENLLQYLSPLGWEHINLQGDYIWKNSIKAGVQKLRTIKYQD